MGGALLEQALTPGPTDGMWPRYWWSPVSLFLIAAIGSELAQRACASCCSYWTSLFSPASFLTRWPVQEGLNPVLSTLSSPPSFFLCLAGAGQFHLLHVSVSVLLVFSEACPSECGSPSSCSPFCSLCWSQSMPSLLTFRGHYWLERQLPDVFLNWGKNLSLLFFVSETLFTASLETLCPLVEIS